MYESHSIRWMEILYAEGYKADPMRCTNESPGRGPVALRRAQKEYRERLLHRRMAAAHSSHRPPSSHHRRKVGYSGNSQPSATLPVMLMLLVEPESNGMPNQPPRSSELNFFLNQQSLASKYDELWSQDQHANRELSHAPAPLCPAKRTLATGHPSPVPEQSCVVG